MRVSDALKRAESDLRLAGIESARLDALLIFEHILPIERAYLSITGRQLTRKEEKQLHRLVQRRIAREPIAYLLGSREFYGLEFKVNKSVLIPRPETEALVEHVSKHAPKDARVLDMGTGSGCIGLTIKNLRHDADVTLSDISADALKVAKRNAKLLKFDVNIIQSDMFNKLKKPFDVVCANLPYVPTSRDYAPELNFEPSIALYSGDDGLDHYRRFLDELEAHIRPGGFCIIEHDPSQLTALKQLTKVKSVSPFISVILV